MSEFNKKLFYDNIEILLKERGIGIGVLESKAGVSIGYTARNKRDERSKPGIDFIMMAAEMLGVGIDALLKVDYLELSPTERYLFDFINKLKEETLHDKLIWNIESADILNSLEEDMDGNVDHPLFGTRSIQVEGFSGYPEYYSETVFRSKNFGIDTAINDDCFNLRMKNGAKLYIMNITKRDSDTNDKNAYAKELWMHVWGNGGQFLCDNKSSKLSSMVEDLYAVIKEDSRHPKISNDYRYAIDAFMKGDLSDDENTDDDMPF